MNITLRITTQELTTNVEALASKSNISLEVETGELSARSVPKILEEEVALIFPSPIVVKGSSGGGSGASRLADLDDVLIQFPQDGDLLVFNGSEWVNKADDYNQRYLRKDRDDTARGVITFLSGFISEGPAVIKGPIGTEKFASGFSGTGWRIETNKAGENIATFDNVIVRKTLQAYEFILNQIHATNGSLWVSDSIKIASVDKIIPAVQFITAVDQVGDVKVFQDTINEPGFTEIYRDSWLNQDNLLENLCQGYETTDPRKHFTVNPIKEEGTFLDIERTLLIDNSRVWLYHSFFKGDFFRVIYEEENRQVLRVNDIIRCQKWDGGIKTFDAIVTKTFTENDRNGCIIRLSTQSILPESLIITPTKGDTLVRIGNTVDTKRQGAIYLTSSENHGPYIDILEKVNSPISQQGLPMVRLGNLDGIVDPAFGQLNRVRGTGIYAANGFFKGRQVHVSADNEELPVTVMRGVWNNMSTYSYGDQVTHKINEIEQLYAAKDTTEINKGKAPDEHPEFWLLITSGQKGDNGTDAKSLSITGPSTFYYADNWKTLETPEGKIRKVLELQNITKEDKEKLTWFIKAIRPADLEEIWINYSIFAKSLYADFYPTDRELNIQIPNGFVLWYKNTLTIQACLGNPNDEANTPEVFDIEALGKTTSGASPYDLVIQSSKGLQFKEGVYNTTVYALIYHKGKLIRQGSPERNELRLSWEIQDKDGITVDTRGDIDEFTITNNDVDFRANFKCTVYAKT